MHAGANFDRTRVTDDGFPGGAAGDVRSFHFGYFILADHFTRANAMELAAKACVCQQKLAGKLCSRQRTLIIYENDSADIQKSFAFGVQLG
jgi:hypothetical protein